MTDQRISPLPLAKETEIATRSVRLDVLPDGVSVLENVGLVAASGVTGQVVFRSTDTLFECRATATPGGDLLVMAPANTVEKPHGRCHYGGQTEKVNDLVSIRSTDGGTSWGEPTRPIDIDYNLHGFIPLIPKGSSRIYNFGTQPMLWLYDTSPSGRENAPIGYRYSDDDGRHWSEVRLIRPTNDPEFRGMSVMRMCETDTGAWLLGSHTADWSYKPLQTRQYILRSEDRGASWEVLPGPRNSGWGVLEYGRMDEGRPIMLADGRVLLMVRTPTGRLWALWSRDDGKSWSAPEPTTLVHPDAPPMLFTLSDGKTLAAFHHNRFHDTDYSGLSGGKEAIMRDRSEIWVALSSDGGESWGEPRFVFANAAAPDRENPFFNHACSYIDAVRTGETWHLFIPHRWQQIVQLTVAEKDLLTMPTQKELR